MCVACVSARKYVCVCHVHLSVSVCVYVYVYAHVNNEQYVHGHTSWPHLTGGTSVCTSICTHVQQYVQPSCTHVSSQHVSLNVAYQDCCC
jgi:hypothetical protein